MSLEERLREILKRSYEAGKKVERGLLSECRLDPWVDEVKKAFKDEGYVKTEVDKLVSEFTKAKIEETKASIERKKVLGEIMTGQEWYEGFEKELKQSFDGHYPNHLDGYGIDTFLEAAKKASGL